MPTRLEVDVPGATTGPSPAPPPERCALTSRRDEPLGGTAPEATRWVLVEDPGPWGRDALVDGCLPAAVRAHLAGEVQRHDVRYQALRRPDRARSGPRAVFLAHVAAGWMIRLDLPVEALATLDLSVLAHDRPPPGTSPADPLVAVCTHAKRDACCALWGRPTALALAARWPDRVWETSHTGGHRFAASVLCLPDGAAHGRVEPDAFAAALDDGRIDLGSYRGRIGLPRPAQAAEVDLRRATGLDRRDDVEVLACDLLDDEASVVVGTDRVAWEVELRLASLPPRPVSCGAAATDPGAWVVAGRRELAGDG